MSTIPCTSASIGSWVHRGGLVPPVVDENVQCVERFDAVPPEYGNEYRIARLEGRLLGRLEGLCDPRGKRSKSGLRRSTTLIGGPPGVVNSGPMYRFAACSGGNTVNRRVPLTTQAMLWLMSKWAATVERLLSQKRGPTSAARSDSEFSSRNPGIRSATSIACNAIAGGRVSSSSEIIAWSARTEANVLRIEVEALVPRGIKEAAIDVGRSDIRADEPAGIESLDVVGHALRRIAARRDHRPVAHHATQNGGAIRRQDIALEHLPVHVVPLAHLPQCRTSRRRPGQLARDDRVYTLAEARHHDDSVAGTRSEWTGRPRFFSTRMPKFACTRLTRGGTALAWTIALLDPQALVEYAAENADRFAWPAVPPGPRLEIEERELVDLRRFVRARLCRHFSIFRGGIDLQACLANVHARAGRPVATANACATSTAVPHPTDGTYAGVIYLFRDPQLGGTAFYRWKRPDVIAEAERLFQRDPPAAMRFLDDASEVFRGPPQYMTATTDLAELLTVVPARFNRLVFYHGEAPHSGHITPPGAVEPRPETRQADVQLLCQCASALTVPAGVDALIIATGFDSCRSITASADTRARSPTTIRCGNTESSIGPPARPHAPPDRQVRESGYRHGRKAMRASPFPRSRT